MALFRGHKALFPRYTTTPGVVYDVFLSFRGEDTRKNFTDHLYTALISAGFRTFRDDPELERGENIKEKLESAIQQSRCSIIVFSEDYTSSRWCLDELIMILERKRTSDHAVFPVFYHVNPSQVRKQAETLANKYQKHQSLEKLNGWRAALREVANLAGMVLENEVDGHESKFIQKIVSVIQDKLGRVSLKDVEEVLQKKLLFIDQYIDDAEGKQLNNPTVKVWLTEIKEAGYDIEDLLQEIKAEALWRRMEAESASSTSKVQELNSSLPTLGFDSAFIQSRVQEVLNKLDSIMDQRRYVLGLEASVGYRVSQTLPTTSLVEDSGVCGRDDEKEKLIKLLLSDDESGNKISVIPIVGMGGIGKTTLAQLLYNDVRIEQHFDIQAWACVSENFDIVQISQQISESLTSDSCFNLNLSFLQSKLKAAVMGKKFFLVLDDVWNKNYREWDVLRRPFQFGAPGSKIVVTTRNQDVASMVCTLEAHCLMPISEKDGWLLFEKHAFKGLGVRERSHLETIGRQIVRKCNGLPLAIKSLGGLLCSKSNSDEWETVLNSEMWELPLEESDILPSLWLSYKYLTLELKRCFAYCSIFPKNYQFERSSLILLWKAVGLLQPTKNKSAEEVGREYFNDLISRSIFQLTGRLRYISCFEFHTFESDDLESYTMHDLHIDLASFVSGEFCYRWDGSDSPNIFRKIRHASYFEKVDSSDMFEALDQAKHLHTLFLGYYWKPVWRKADPITLLPKLQCLRILKLSNYHSGLPDSFNSLKLLRLLDLSNSYIERLPDTICTLYNLQALLLRYCGSLTELPANLGRLINLVHLDITRTGLQKMPPNMGNLKELQILPEFVLDKESAGDNLLELKKLQNLRGRLCISGLVHCSSLEAYILTDMKFLKELDLTAMYLMERRYASAEGNKMVEEREVLEKLQPHQKLERLTIKYYGGKMLPCWSGYYSSSDLVYLQLVNCENISSLPPLGQLPSLRELVIKRLDEVVSIGSEFYYGDGNTTTCVNKPFRSLRSLQFNEMWKWKEWCYVGGDDNASGIVFPNLVELDLSNCEKLTGTLALDSFPMLKEVGLYSTKLSLLTRSADSKLVSMNNLKLRGCPNIASFPDGGLHAPNLTNLEMTSCWKLSSWPEQMEALLPSLLSLRANWCQELECFPEGGFPSKLKFLLIEKCKKLNAKSVQILKKGCLRTLTSLEELTLDLESDEKDKDWFAEMEEGMFPSSLTDLKILHLNYETIDGAKWFGHLNSLKELVIEDCPSLQCLPESGLPSSLQRLDIHNCPAMHYLSESGLPSSLKELVIMKCPALQCLPNSALPSIEKLVIRKCPLLKKRYQRETGEDWPKVAHIPDVIWH